MQELSRLCLQVILKRAIVMNRPSDGSEPSVGNFEFSEEEEEEDTTFSPDCHHH